MRFFVDTVVPLSLTNIAALFVILFIYGWNQYLWPLLASSTREMTTMIIGMRQMIGNGDTQTEWHIVMATALLAIVPPVLVRAADAALVRQRPGREREMSEVSYRPAGISDAADIHALLLKIAGDIPLQVETLEQEEALYAAVRKMLAFGQSWVAANDAAACRVRPGRQRRGRAALGRERASQPALCRRRKARRADRQGAGAQRAGHRERPRRKPHRLGRAAHRGSAFAKRKPVSASGISAASPEGRRKWPR